MVEAEEEIKVRIIRFNPRKDKKPQYVLYKVPYVKGMSVLNVLTYIYENLDSSLAYFVSCRIGKCGGCTAMVNGKATRVCTEPVRGDLTIEPLRGYKIIKDLVLDLEGRKKELQKVSK